MNNNYKITRTIYENVFQRILECKDDDTGAIFYSNIITSSKVMNLINISELKKLKSNIIECYNTEDRIYIFTRYLETDYRKLTDLVKDELTLREQFSLAEGSINLAASIYNMTDVVQQKILDPDRLYIDENKDLIVDCNLIFEQEYDIADNESFKRLGNIIHMIFSGTEIIDYNISETIAPDILKIIVRCLTREYASPSDALVELKKSPIYKMILGEEVAEDISKDGEKQVPIKLVSEKNAETDDNVLNIYLETETSKQNDEKTGKRKKDADKTGNIYGEIKRAGISLLIVALVLLIGNTIIKNLGKNKETGAINNVNQPPAGQKPLEGEDPLEKDPLDDSTDINLNEELLGTLGYEGKRAQKDTDIYVEGDSSMLVANDGPDVVKALFAAVDFTDEDFKYMLMKQIGISAKLKSQHDTEAQIVFEAYKDGLVKSNFHTLVNLYDDIWSPITLPINVTDADALFIYLEYEGENKVWIDSLLIDVIK